MSGNVRNSKKNAVVVFLLSGSTIEQAAQLADVSDRQVHRWLKDPDFLDQLHQAERQVLDACSWRLVSLSNKALDALETCLDAPAGRVENSRRLAAVSVLELLLKWRDVVDFETRLQALERKAFHE